MSSVIVKQVAVRKVAQAAIDWFDGNVERKIASLWTTYDRELASYRELPWWRRLFASRPTPPDQEILFFSAEGMARNEGGLWKLKAQDLLDACGTGEGEAFVDAQTWGVLTTWARYGGLK